MRRLTALLRQSGVTARKQSACPHRPNARLVDPFREYLLKERGLKPSTAIAYARWADRFLSWRFAADRVCVRRLTGRDLMAFIQHREAQTSQAELCHLVAALRALGRFLHYSGRLARDLSTAIPAVARWSLADVPVHLSPKTVERVLARCDAPELEAKACSNTCSAPGAQLATTPPMSPWKRRLPSAS